METLVEYLTYIKGLGYLLVVAFLFAFITFWLMVHTKNKEIVKILQVMVVIWLAFGIASALVTKIRDKTATADAVLEPAITEPVFPEYYGNGTPATITAHRVEKWLGVNRTEYLAISYGSAAHFHKVMSTKIGCTDCHHNSGDEIHTCKDCHDAPFNPENMSKPGLKAAIHNRCMYCHREIFVGPEGCKLCHTKDSPVSVAIQTPARPHQLTWEDCTRCHTRIPGGQEIKIVYHDFCIKCHTIGIAGATKLPSDHAGLTSDICKGCHKPIGR